MQQRDRESIQAKERYGYWWDGGDAVPKLGLSGVLKGVGTTGARPSTPDGVAAAAIGMLGRRTTPAHFGETGKVAVKGDQFAGVLERDRCELCVGCEIPEASAFVHIRSNNARCPGPGASMTCEGCARSAFR